MNWGLLSMGFILGTWKFMFAHWAVYAAYGADDFQDLIPIFISVTAGAWVCMSIFYFSSSFFMERARKKRIDAIISAKQEGKPYKGRKTFTRINKGIVWIKRNVGVYGVTFLAPLFLSIPIGSIVCAKFYGKRKSTFPLMLIYTAAYSAVMCSLIYLNL